MSDLGKLSYFLEMEFKDTGERVFLHQKKYAQDILKKFKMSNCNAPATPLEIGAKLKKETNDEFLSATMYKQIIGSFRYIFKRVLRYIKVTIHHGVLMPRQKKTITHAEVHGYTYSNFNGDQDKNKNIAGYIFMIGGTPISWSSRKKSIVALSSCEVEYVVASYAACQAVWI
ncbi:secreted RxLR effector protein 161-like [Vicia villosa]|uniref:secreted RxLR effector protein 161-like n=1 Tax=Vicia villosa TaxID=3911 RepID=UPI00273BC02F|nr:secreted RxLR effector protein 161-like [Vicia villosa]